MENYRARPCCQQGWSKRCDFALVDYQLRAPLRGAGQPLGVVARGLGGGSGWRRVLRLLQFIADVNRVFPKSAWEHEERRGGAGGELAAGIDDVAVDE
jgi:hypothetical protein